MVSHAVWETRAPLRDALFEEVRRQAIFEACKWDPQVEDVSTLAPYPLVLRPSAWAELRTLAEQLGAETLAAEEELRQRPELHRLLGLPRALRKALGDPRVAVRSSLDHGDPRVVRIMRFDFHLTTEGWRLSEVNSDVPGGFNEASGFTALMAPHHADLESCGDPVEALGVAIEQAASPGATVALVHATAYSDDRQVMTYLARRWRRRGLRPVLAGPDHLDWRGGGARLAADWHEGAAGFVFRFFPAEWLPNLRRGGGWIHYFRDHATPLCNPATALLTQSKRWPLTWDQLRARVPAWRRHLPETRDPAHAPWKRSDEWVVKPALGRVGEMIGIPGVTPTAEWRRIRRSLCWHRAEWAAQRRFEPVAFESPEGPRYPCLGVYTVRGRAAGVYGRISALPLINHRAQDIAILVEPTSTSPSSPGKPAHPL